MKVIYCGKIIVGTGKTIENVVISIKDSKIIDISTENDFDFGEEIDVYDWSNLTVLPGLIDTHLHLALGPGKNYVEQFSNSDAIQLVSGVVNAKCTLDAGVTTVRDCGSRNRVAFDLRSAEQMNMILSPRLLVCGRSITMTGGHFHYCNAEADGYGGVLSATRQLIKEGSDFIKIMTSGGGTVGTRRDLPSYTVEEIKAAVDVAHSLDMKVTAHCHATQAIINAVEAGVAVIEHCSFLEPDRDGSVKHNFREDVAIEISKKGIYVDNILNPTQIDSKRLLWSYEDFQGFRNVGVKILPGTDGLRLFQTGLMALELEMWLRGGASAMETLEAATRVSAEAINMSNIIGTIEPGKEADLIAVDGDPLKNISTLRAPKKVMKSGKVITPSGRTEPKRQLDWYTKKIYESLDKIGDSFTQ